MITAALQPTALTIRHSRFATLTLAKLVASLALHPPVSATEADYAPHRRLRRSLSSRRSLWVGALTNYRTPPRLIIAPNHAPWHADEIGAGRAQHDRRGNIQGDGWRLRRSGHAEFSLPRGSPPSPAFQFYSSSFYVTHRFFVTFFTEESNVLPAPSSHQKSQPAVERAGQLTV